MLQNTKEYKDITYPQENYSEIIDFCVRIFEIEDLSKLRRHIWQSQIKSLFLDDFSIKQIKWGILRARQKKTVPHWGLFKNVAYILLEAREQAQKSKKETTDKPESIGSIIAKL